MYELLKNISLAEFDLINWQSEIRGRVGVHPNYERLLNWPQILDITIEQGTTE